MFMMWSYGLYYSWYRDPVECRYAEILQFWCNIAVLWCNALFGVSYSIFLCSDVTLCTDVMWCIVMSDVLQYSVNTYQYGGRTSPWFRQTCRRYVPCGNQAPACSRCWSVLDGSGRSPAKRRTSVKVKWRREWYLTFKKDSKFEKSSKLSRK